VKKLPSGKLYSILIGIGIFPFLINGYINSVIYSYPFWYWSFELLSWVILPATVMTVAIRFGGLRAADIGLSLNVRGRRAVVLLLLICVVIGPVELYLYESAHTYFKHLFPGKAFFEYESLVPASGIARFLVSLYFSLSAGIVEELYFRGLMFKAAGYFAQPVPVYLIVSPLLFALIHWEGGLANVAATLVFGIATAAVFVAIRNLWPLIIGHIYTDYFWFS